jgi:HK97 family phage prohead protease
MKQEIKNLAFKASNITNGGTFGGYAAVFGNVDHDGDIIVKGAFAKTIAEYQAKNRRPALLWQHQRDQPIGIWEEMSEDDTGLAVKGRLLIDDVARAKEVYALLKAEAISGMSIGYYARDYSMDDKTYIRTLKEIELLEASLVTFPANDEARVSTVKSKPQTIREFETILRDAIGFSAKEAKIIASSGFKARDVSEFSKDTKAIIDEIVSKYL